MTSPTAGKTEPINDMQMYYEIRGDGEPLVLLHGFTGVGSNWELVFQEPPVGFQLIIPDLRGHGRSTNPSNTFTFRQAALDVYGLLDRLEVRRFKGVGLSAGGNTLLHMATQQPDRVEAMALVSAAPYFPPQARAIMAQTGGQERSETEWAQMRGWHPQGDEQIQALWAQGAAFKDSYEDLNFTPPLLSTITARTLIVHGDRDPLYPVSLAVELFASVPRSFLWVIPNGGHSPIFGEYTGGGETTQRFAETAVRFLRSEWE
jgi:pimeloyl-ACP methyl ester carboxylesterase